MTDISVRFHTAIDAYQTKRFPARLQFRPLVGDRVPFAGQSDSRLPVLTISKVSYLVNTDGSFQGFDCYLDMVDVHPELAHKVLTHRIQ